MTRYPYPSPAAAMVAGACSYVIASAAGMDHPCGRPTIVAFWYDRPPAMESAPRVAACAIHDARIARDTHAAGMRAWREPQQVPSARYVEPKP